MSIFDNYQREEIKHQPRTGIRRCVVVAAEETVSKKTGKPMLVVTVRPSGSQTEIRDYMVQNEYFNRNLTAFLDAFPTIKSQDLATWVGAIGAANFGEDEKGYLKVKFFVTPDKAQNLPPFAASVPVQQELTTIPSTQPADDGLPF